MPKFTRMSMWIDKIQKNLSDIEEYFNSNDYSGIRRELQDQYKLVMILRDTMDGKVKLQGVSRKATWL